jgi:hypothetical protein
MIFQVWGTDSEHYEISPMNATGYTEGAAGSASSFDNERA